MATKANATKKDEQVPNAQERKVVVTIPALNLQVAEFEVQGDSLLKQHAFSEKARKVMHDTQAAGTQSSSRKKREPRDFQAEYEAAKHVSEEGWIGIPCAAFRAAMIDACRTTDLKMTVAKQSLRIQADGRDRLSGTDLVRIYGDEPEYSEDSVRLETGVCSLVARPMWRNWYVKLRVEWDGDRHSVEDIANLLQRAGRSCGVGEGRNNSPKSYGQGWGCFHVAVANEPEKQDYSIRMAPKSRAQLPAKAA